VGTDGDSDDPDLLPSARHALQLREFAYQAAWILVVAEAVNDPEDLIDVPPEERALPKSLPPCSSAEPVDVLVPIGILTNVDMMRMLSVGESLQVGVDHVDGTPAPAPVVECFVFRLVEGAGGTNWVSYRETCPLDRNHLTAPPVAGSQLPVRLIERT
jgi:hypothetical protein